MDIRKIIDALKGQPPLTVNSESKTSRLGEYLNLVESELVEGNFVVKSRDGVEKRFKDHSSPEALAWASSFQKQSKISKKRQNCLGIVKSAITIADWSDQDVTDVISHQIIPKIWDSYMAGEDEDFHDSFYLDLRMARQGSWDHLEKWFDAAVKEMGYKNFQEYTGEMSSYTGDLGEDLVDMS